MIYLRIPSRQWESRNKSCAALVWHPVTSQAEQCLMWLVQQWRHPNHGMVNPDLGQVQGLLFLLLEPAPMTSTDGDTWQKSVWAFVSAISELHSFINSLQPFWSKFSVLSFALSSFALSENRDEELPQPASVERSQYFKVTAFATWFFYCL